MLAGFGGMISKHPERTTNEEAIPPEQPNAASPGPEGEREQRSSGRSGWALLLAFLVGVVVIGALYRSGGF